MSPALPHPAVVIADDHPLFRAALRLAVERALPGAVITEAESFDGLREAVTQRPDAELVLLDLHMPGVQGFGSLVWLRAEHPSLPVVMVSASEEAATIHRALDFGAAGFIPKSTPLEMLIDAIRQVLDGQRWTPALPGRSVEAEHDAEQARRVASLSPQQLRVLWRLADGSLNKQIAYDFGITEATIKAHVTAILRKLGLVRRTQAAVLAQRLSQVEAVSLDVRDVAGVEED